MPTQRDLAPVDCKALGCTGRLAKDGVCKWHRKVQMNIWWHPKSTALHEKWFKQLTKPHFVEVKRPTATACRKAMALFLVNPGIETQTKLILAIDKHMGRE